MAFIVNETPVKTSKNYHINHLEIPGFSLPQPGEFANFLVKCSDMTCVSQEKQDISLEFGMNDALLTQSQNNSNVSVHINLAENQQLTENIFLNFDFDEDNANLVDQIKITAGKNSKANILIRYHGKVSGIFKNTVIQAEIGELAEVSVSIITLLPYDSYNFITMQEKSEKDSEFTLTLADFSGKYSLCNLFSELVGEQAKSNMNLIYLGKEEQVLDYNLITRLRGKRSQGNIEVQGVLDGKARKSFKGTLDFCQGAVDSVGYENEYCTMLSEDCVSLALPMLLCQEEDVEGTHSSASGKLDEDILFYIQSRGIPEEEARKLIVKANFYHIIQAVPCEKLKGLMMAEIEGRMT